jgi:hypothetical protein
VHVHKVVLEEILQLSLGGRVGEVSNVQSPALSGRRNDSLVLAGIDGLVAAGAHGGALGGGGRLVEGRGGHLGRGSVNGGHGAGRSMG